MMYVNFCELAKYLFFMFFCRNLGPVSRLLRRRHHATSLATKSCDNIYSVNKANSFFEWKHGHNAHHDHHQGRGHFSIVYVITARLLDIWRCRARRMNSFSHMSFINVSTIICSHWDYTFHCLLFFFKW